MAQVEDGHLPGMKLMVTCNHYHRTRMYTELITSSSTKSHNSHCQVRYVDIQIFSPAETSIEFADRSVDLITQYLQI